MDKIRLPWDSCTGCAACMNICPVEAISLPEDGYGFIHANINTEKCIKCHLCEKTCPVYVPIFAIKPQRTYAAKAKNENIRLSTASGGVATLLSKFLLQRNAVVYGCCQLNYKEIKHIRISDPDDVVLLRNSKYVQSDIDYVFKEIKRDLDDYINVLFIGTPCQVAGLLNYLKKPYDNLFTIDLICHGVPPLRMLEEQVETEINLKNLDQTNLHVNFRWKTINDGKITVHFGMQLFQNNHQNKEILETKETIHNAYMRNFMTGVSLRESCLKCLYAKPERISDLTLGDFWGLGYEIPSILNAQNGVSLILINTKKGSDLFEMIKGEIDFEEYSLEQAQLKNQCLKSPYSCSPKRDRFLHLYQEKGLIDATVSIDPIFKFENYKIIKILRKTFFTNFLVKIVFKILRITKIIKV